MKRIISLLLVVATLISCLALNISANEGIVSDEGRLPFEDVKDSYWFSDAAKFCYANGIIKGINAYTFGFSGKLTRAQFMMMLANLEGVDTSKYTVSHFVDVQPDNWFYGSVAWAYENGIAEGYYNSKFDPNGVLTRAQLATVMFNYMERKYSVEIKDGVLDGFSDKPKKEYWYYDAMEYAVSAGLLEGMQDGTLAATGTVTRAQAAVIFENFSEKYFYATCWHVFSEADCTKAATCENCGLADGLAKGHRLKEYDCLTGGVCTVCNAEVEPSSLIHDFADATCTKPQMCKLCSYSRENPKGHSWIPWTCTEPKTCSVCGVTEGTPHGHLTSNGICICGTEVFPTKYDKVVYFLRNYGDYKNFEGIGTSYESVKSGKSVTSLKFTFSPYKMFIDNVCEYGNGGVATTKIELTKTPGIYKYSYLYYVGEHGRFYGVGYLDSTTYNFSTAEAFSACKGELLPEYTEKMNETLRAMLRDTDLILSQLYDGGSIEDLGFTNAK